MEEDELLTVKDIAEIFRVNQQTVRNWIDRGELDAVRVGRRVRIRRSDVDALIGTRRSQPDVEQDHDEDSRLPSPFHLEIEPRVIESLRAVGHALVDLSAALERQNSLSDPGTRRRGSRR